MTKPLRAALEGICASHEILAVWVFGSRAGEIAGRVRGETSVPGPRGADADVGILVRRGATLDARSRVRIAARLEDLFEVERVDLVIVGEASPFLAADIVQGELIVDRSPRETAEFELYALRRAGDLLPFRRARTKAILKESAR